MKKQLLLLLLPALAAFNAAAGGNTITLGPDVMTIDTIFHAKVGPGTTQTQLHLTGGPNLNVFYLTVDLTTPGVSMRAVCPGGKIAGNARTSAMAEGNSNEHTLYFAGTNGDFYYTSGKATDGTSLVGTPTYGAIVDGEVYKSSGAGYQFTVDAAGIPRVCRISFHDGTATKGDQTVPFRGVNVDASNNAVTLYTPRGWTSPCQGGYAGNCSEVYARLVEGDAYRAGGTFRVEVTSTPTSTGDLPVPADGCVLMARGSARAFIDALVPGDIVTLDNVITTPEGERIYPTQCVSGNPKNVLLGANAQSESERGDASDRHPRTGIGYSADGNKIIMMVVDGRGVSKGVTTGMLGDLMIYAGAYEAVNLDGGGSSTLYTAALGVRNHCSDGNERPVGNGIFATVDGDVNDTEVAELQFVDWHKTVPQMAMYTPQVYAFNAAGVMISSDFRDYTLTCPPELGTITDDGHTLLASGEGCHALTVTYGNAKTASIAVDIVQAEITPRLARVILQPGATYPIELKATTATGDVPVSPAAFVWESSDNAVVTVDEAGVATGVANGTATLTGSRGDVVLTVAVDVQTPAADVIPVESELAGWSVKKTLMSAAEISILENGLTLDYTMGSNARGAKLTLNARKELPARPMALRIRMNAATVTPASVGLTFKAANAAKNTVVTNDQIDLTAGSWTWELPLSDYYELSDPAVYPIEFVSMVVSPADAAKAVGHIEMPGIEVVYPEGASGVEEITVDAAVADGEAEWYNLAGVRVAPTNLAPGIYIRRIGSTATKIAIR